MSINLMEKFAKKDRSHLIGNWDVEYINSNETPHLYINDMRVLAGFTGYLKFQCWEKNKSKVYYRGQREPFTLIPSLFREITDKNKNIIETTNERLQTRYKAYAKLVEEIKHLYEATRFQENFGPVLQHYGIRTPWIDLIDNVFVAVWFATHKFNSNETNICKPDDGYRWIYFMEIKEDQMKYEDLREFHTSLSLRLHTQHGISATRKTNAWNMENRNLDEYVIARVKIPKDMTLDDDNVFSAEYMFPSEEFDNTYKYLKKQKFTDLLVKIVEESGLEPEELGNINDYSDKS